MLNKAEFIDISTFLYYSIYILARTPGNNANRLLGRLQASWRKEWPTPAKIGRQNSFLASNGRREQKFRKGEWQSRYIMYILLADHVLLVMTGSKECSTERNTSITEELNGSSPQTRADGRRCYRVRLPNGSGPDRILEDKEARWQCLTSRNKIK